MHLARLSIRHPIATLMVIIIALLVGVVSLTESPMELMPKINPPVAVVMTTYPGASPAEVSRMVTEPVEEAVATAAGATKVSSTSRENLSLVIVQFTWGTDMNEARSDLQERLDRLALPEGTRKPSLIKFDPNAMPVLELAAATGEDLTALQARLEQSVVPRLEAVEGVAAVSVTGAATREIQIQLDQAKLSQFRLSQAQIAGIVQASNLTYPAGRITLDGRPVNLRVLGELADVEALKQLVIGAAPDPRGGLLTLKLQDVAEVADVVTPAPVINRVNGQLSLKLAVQKEGEANTVAVARAVKAELAKLEGADPSLDLLVTLDQAEVITRSVSNVSTAMAGGGLLAILILLLFLRSLRPTLIVGVAIPFSVIVTFVLLYMADKTLNIMTLGGLTLGVGMLVDNAIVVIENIYRRLNDLGEAPAVAAERGAGEVAGAITASTLTTVAVFLPVMFVGGLTGELFKDMAMTVTFSLLASLAVALTLVPMMAAQLLKPRRSGVSVIRRERFYTRTLRWALRNRAVTLVAALAVLAGSLSLVPRIGTEFIPAVDEGSFSVQVTMPPATPLSTTAAKVDQLTALVAERLPGAVMTTTVGGEGLGMEGGVRGPNEGVIAVKLPAGFETPTRAVMLELEPVLAEQKGDAVVGFRLESTMTMGEGGSSSLELAVSGPDPEGLRAAVTKVETAMAGVPGLVDIRNTLEASKPEFQVVVDQARAMQAGLPPAQVAMAVADAVKGRLVTQLGEGGRTVDVRLLFRAADTDSAEAIGNLPLRTPTGQTVMLKDVATLQEAFGPVSISRQGQNPTAQVTGRADGRDLGSVTADVKAKLASLDLGGYDVKVGGSAEMMMEGMDGLLKALIMAILLIYMIMAAQFESLRYPFTIMFSMPLAVTGVVLGLVVAGYPVGITVMIGIIILAGIVVNNGIVLVDFINQMRAAGLGLTEAIVEAGRSRIRPIFMTALTTILGLLPMALGFGTGTELQAPMAVAVIGGLTTSTVLTLVVIPVLYSVFSGRAPVGKGEPVQAAAD